MPRTLIRTATSGWFQDTADLDGKKVRKQDGDTVISREDFEEAGGSVAAEQTALEAAAPQIEAAARAIAQERTASRKPSGPADARVTSTSTGKVVVGKTTEIQCAWVDPEHRSTKQNKMLKGDRRKIDYTKIARTADGQGNVDRVNDGEPCGKARTIKVQDAFQVRFCPEHQKAHRAEVRRDKNRKRRADIKAAKTA